MIARDVGDASVRLVGVAAISVLGSDDEDGIVISEVVFAPVCANVRVGSSDFLDGRQDSASISEGIDTIAIDGVGNNTVLASAVNVSCVVGLQRGNSARIGVACALVAVFGNTLQSLLAACNRRNGSNIDSGDSVFTSLDEASRSELRISVGSAVGDPNDAVDNAVALSRGDTLVADQVLVLIKEEVQSLRSQRLAVIAPVVSV